ncbi:MAG: class I SAM-dependent methyltransferase [Bacteroidota bacterium]
MQASSVEWQTYAQSYDLLLSYNPFYQALREQVLSEIQKWAIPAGGIIIDIGAGTGNYSTSIAKEHPDWYVYHVDRDPGMIARAREKQAAYSLNNLSIFQQAIEDTQFGKDSIAGIAAIHSLYTFPSPKKVLRQFYEWMEPGGYGIFVDPGRKVNVLSWQWAIGKHLLKTYGLKKTLDIMKGGKEVSRQNRKIQRMQARGEFWLHSHEEFCNEVLEAGFSIAHADTTFRGISDLLVVRKPQKP